MGGAGAEIFYLEPEPKKKNIWRQSQGKWFGSATVDYIHAFLMKTILFKLINVRPYEGIYFHILFDSLNCTANIM